MFNKMAIYRCILCNKEYNTKQSSPLSLPCGDIFCEQCLLLHYNKKNELIKCQKHKKEFIIEFNKYLNYSNTLTNMNRVPLEQKDLGFYCNKHNKKILKYFCDYDNNFFCENCLNQHEGHKYSEVKLSKENFLYEINALKYNFENLKNKYLNEKNKINQYFINSKKNIEEQINKVNNYFTNLISQLNEKKMQMIREINNKEKMNLKKLENIKNIFLISDEKYNFINNEFYYINNELLTKGDYITFEKTKKNFLKLIDNFFLYINKNIFNNNEIYNNNLINYIFPKNNIFEDIFGKIEEKPINLNNNKKINKSNISPIPDQKETENENINSINNEGDSFIDKQMVETGNTFYLINKNNVKNVFKQQDSDITHTNEIVINKDNNNYINNNKNNFILNNINNINEIRKNYYENKMSENKANNRNNNLLNKMNNSKNKAPYKLLNITNNNKEGNNSKNKEKIKYNKINKTKEINHNYSNLNIKSEDNRHKIGKEKLNINNKRNNSNKKFYNLKNNYNNILRDNSLNKRDNISYICTNNKNNSSLISNNLISSYNKEYSRDFTNKKEKQILTEINDKNKRIIKAKYSYRDLNKRVVIRNDNSKLNSNKKEIGAKRGRSTRQKNSKNSYTEMEILI